MTTFQVTKSIEFDYGHRVPDHNSKCKNVHGHRGKVEVTVEGPLQPAGSSNGMVLDFGDIKTALLNIDALFDHTFLMFVDDPMRRLWSTDDEPADLIYRTWIGNRYTVRDFGVVQEVSFVPTAENLAALCFKMLASYLDAPARSIKVVSVKFWETPTSCAIYSGVC